MPVAHGLGLGFDPAGGLAGPAADLRRRAARSRHGAGRHGVRVGARRRRGVQPRRRADHRRRTRGADEERYRRSTAALPSEPAESVGMSKNEAALGRGDHPLREGPEDQDRDDHVRSARVPQRADVGRAVALRGPDACRVQRRQRRQGGRDPRRRRQPRQRRRPARVHGGHRRSRAAACGSSRSTAWTSSYPPKGTFRNGATISGWYANVQAGNRPLQELKKISIVEAKGYCYGWHFYQCADADLVISSDDALFGHPSFRYYGWGPRMWTWVQMMGLRKFQEMVFTGRPFTAEDMEKCNFLNKVVSREDLEAETAEVRAGVRPQPARRHRLHAEAVLRGVQAAPGRVHGQPAVGLLRVDGQRCQPTTVPTTSTCTRPSTAAWPLR